MPKKAKLEMVKIRQVARIDPRDKFEFFRDKPELWRGLKNGETVEVPQELFVQMSGVVEVADSESGPSERILEGDAEGSPLEE